MNTGALIHEALRLGQEAEEKRDYVGISQIGYCVRKVVKEFLNTEKTKHPPKVLMKWMVGSATHEYLQALLWKHRGRLSSFKFKKSEKDVIVNLPSGRTMKGHADLIAEIDGKETVIDFKVYAGSAMARLDGPHEHYVDQLTMYAYGLGLEWCELTYVNKDDGDYKSFVWNVDKEHIKNLLCKADLILEHCEKGILPDKPFDHPDDTWECGYCPFYDSCWPVRIEKSDDKVEIPADMVEEFIRLNDLKKDLEVDMADIKGRIEGILQGKKGFAPGVTAYFIEPKTEVGYDKKLLQAHIRPDELAKCEKVTEKKGYYVIKALGD